jgi:hypothetical protein
MYLFTLFHFLFSRAGKISARSAKKARPRYKVFSRAEKIGSTGGGGATLMGEDASWTDLKGRGGGGGKKRGCCHESESPSQHGAEGL